MRPVLTINCTSHMANALGAKPMERLHRPKLSFPVYDEPKTLHMEFVTELGLFAWFIQIDSKHPVQQPPGWKL